MYLKSVKVSNFAKHLLFIIVTLSFSPSAAECIKGSCWNGKGTYKYKNGTYTGDWVRGDNNGKGTYYWDNGDSYIGDWKGGNRTGKGTYRYASGITYEGNFFLNKRHGEGVLTWENGTKKVGVWEMGKYFGSKEAWDKKEKARKAKEELERIAREEAKRKYDKIYNACLLKKSSGVDMQVSSVRKAVEETCAGIASDPSWLDKMRYN